MSSHLVIVESPAKAKTIEKYLGGDYHVLASFGHVRDLPSKDGSVRPDDDFAMEWEVSDRARKNLGDIEKAAKRADVIVLATDPDREGEAISWHVQDYLTQRKIITAKHRVERVTFNEITKSAIVEAFSHPRQVNSELVEAYLARRALDYLVGFNLSPILWRKLPGAKSAGRVQSVALRLICEREDEIEKFRADEYWSIDVAFKTPKNDEFTARLTHFNGKKLEKLTIADSTSAMAIAGALESKHYSVATLDKKQIRRNPPPPFITSTLQMEASRKLGFGASRTMRAAQRLYEGVDIGGETTGLITYMRTDGVTLSADAIASARGVIESRFGKNYLPASARQYTSKAKNAQEAHEAIRPTDLSRTPEQVAQYVGGDEARLYEIIWQRTLACQMEQAIMDQVAVDILSNDNQAQLRAVGTIVAFDGFLRVYAEGQDDDADDDDNRRLPTMQPNDALKRGAVNPEQHFTQPPPRYTEASLVKRLEELGIGRPSTYASIIQVLQDRTYVRLEKKRFIPEDRGRIVTSFLDEYFRKYVEYDFTAQLEEQLDDISGGRAEWKKVLRTFWDDFTAALNEAKPLTITQVIDALDAKLEMHFFAPREDGSNPRACPSCTGGRLGLKLGKFGAFIGCSNYPDCNFTRKLGIEETTVNEDGETVAVSNEPRELGAHPDTGEIISLRRGPYGPYVQIDVPAGSKEKPKRSSLPRGTKDSDVTLEIAVKLLELPRKIGLFPETGEMIESNNGRFGPYVKAGTLYANIPKGEDAVTVGLNRAVDLLMKKMDKMANDPAYRARAEKAAERAAAKKAAKAKKTSPRKKAASTKTTTVKKAAAKKTTTVKKAAAKPAAKKAAVKKTVKKAPA